MTSSASGQAHADLPLNYPTAADFLTPMLQIDINNLGSTAIAVAAPNLSSLVQALNPSTNLQGLPAAFQDFFAKLQALLNATSLSPNFPVAGGVLQNATFLSDIGTSMAQATQAQFNASGTATSADVNQAAVNAGFGLTDSYVPPGPNPAGSIPIPPFPTLTIPIPAMTKELKAGIPGLTLTANPVVVISGTATLNLPLFFSPALGLGLNTSGNSEIVIDLSGTLLSAPIDGTFSDFNVSATNQGTHFVAHIRIDLGDTNGQGYLTGDVGRPKVEATAAAIRQLDSSITVE